MITDDGFFSCLLLCITTTNSKSLQMLIISVFHLFNACLHTNILMDMKLKDISVLQKDVNKKAHTCILNPYLVEQLN